MILPLESAEVSQKKTIEIEGFDKVVVAVVSTVSVFFADVV